MILDKGSENRILGSGGLKGFRFIRLSFILLAVVHLMVIPWPGFFYGLQVTHLPKARVLMILPFVLHHPFSLSYTHSIYLAPVVESFEVEGTQIHVRGISTNHWGVVEYYGISKAEVTRKGQGEIWMGRINVRLPKITIMIGFIGKQRLTWGNRTHPLFSLAAPGEKLKIEPVSLSPGRYLWERMRLL